MAYPTTQALFWEVPSCGWGDWSTYPVRASTGCWYPLLVSSSIMASSSRWWRLRWRLSWGRADLSNFTLSGRLLNLGPDELALFLCSWDSGVWCNSACWLACNEGASGVSRRRSRPARGFVMGGRGACSLGGPRLLTVLWSSRLPLPCFHLPRFTLSGCMSAICTSSLGDWGLFLTSVLLVEAGEGEGDGASGIGRVGAGGMVASATGAPFLSLL